MNKVEVIVYMGGIYMDHYKTDDVNRAMDTLQEARRDGWTTKWIGPFGTRVFQPPIESVVSQFPDDSQVRHDRNRARQKLP